MPKTRTFKTGSVLYFEGDKAKSIYILKKGQLQNIHISIETGKEVREKIQIGEFIGVRNVLGGYPHDETIQVLSDAELVQLSPKEFEMLVSKNVPVMLKIMRVFSNQLRRIGKKIPALLNQPVISTEPTTEIFKTGEFYFNEKRWQQALYAFNKYIELAGSTSEFYETAQKRIAKLKKKLGEELSAEEEASLNKKAEAAQESSTDADEGAEAEEESEPMEESKVDLETVFYEGMSLYSKQQYKESLAKYKKIMEAKNMSGSEMKHFENAHFEAGRCYFMLKKYGECLKIMSELVKRFKKNDHVKEALLFMGKAYLEKNNTEKARGYLKKVAASEEKDDAVKEAANLLKKLDQ